MPKPEPESKPRPESKFKDDELDKLYRTPLSEFVFRRNALATELKKAGDADGAKRVKALVKPNASAWAVNQLYWKEPLSFAALIEAGDRYRDTFSKQLQQGAREDAERERLEAVRDATGIARALLERSAQSASTVVMRRVETTLDALASYGSANPNPMDGRLTRDLEPPGFAAFAALAPAPAPAPAPPHEPEHEKPPETRDDVACAKELLREREAAFDETRGARDAATKRADALTKQLEQLHDQIERAHIRVEEAETAVAETETLVEEAKMELEMARAETDAADQ